MIVAEVMTELAIAVEVSASVSEAVELMERISIRHLPVVDEGRLVGMLSDRDLAGLRLAGGEAQPDLAQLMNGDAVTVYPESDLRDAIETLLEARVGALPVVSNDELSVVGVLSYVDILRSQAELLNAVS